MAAIKRILAFALVAALAILAILAFGCGGNADKWVGTWKGRRQGLVQKELEDTDIGRSLSLIQITIKPEGRFELVEAGIPMKGEVTFGKDRVYLKIMSRLDRALDVPHSDLTLEWQPDGSVLYYDPDGGHPQPAELRKETDPPTSP